MCQHTASHACFAHLLCATGVAIAVSAAPAAAQIYLNPIQQNMTRSRVSIDMGDGLRCTSDGGSVPTLSLSMGAYPDQWGSDVTVYERNTGSQSSLLGLVSVHVPLGGTSQKFDCNALLKDAKIRARLDNLRELVDENIISDAQYRAAVLQLYQPILDSAPKEENAAAVSGTGKRGSVLLSGRSETPSRVSETVVAPGDPRPADIAATTVTALSSPPPLPPLPEAGFVRPLNGPWGAPAIAASD
jgi:hypothetical protein